LNKKKGVLAIDTAYKFTMKFVRLLLTTQIKYIFAFLTKDTYYSSLL